MATVVLKTEGYCRVATENCIATMLPKPFIQELDQAATTEGLSRSAMVRTLVCERLAKARYGSEVQR